MDKKQNRAREAQTAYEADSHEDTIRTTGLPEQYVVDREGKKLGVILSFERYQQIREDLHDLAVFAERRGEESISLEEMKRRLTEDGLL